MNDRGEKVGKSRSGDGGRGLVDAIDQDVGHEGANGLHRVGVKGAERDVDVDVWKDAVDADDASCFPLSSGSHDGRSLVVGEDDVLDDDRLDALKGDETVLGFAVDHGDWTSFLDGRRVVVSVLVHDLELSFGGRCWSPVVDDLDCRVCCGPILAFGSWMSAIERR